MKARHLAALSAFIISLLSIAIFVLVTGLKEDPKPISIGSIDMDGVKISIYQSGDCKIFAAKWKAIENANIFYSCPIKSK